MVGITCNSDQDDFLLMKYFSKLGVSTIFTKLILGLQVTRFLRTTHHKLGVIIDTRCLDKQDVALLFIQASARRQFDELHHWLIIASKSDNLTTLIYDNSFDLSTDFVVAISLPKEFVLYDVYNVNKNRNTKLNVTFMGTWNYNSSLQISLTQNKYTRRSNLHKMIWRVGYFSSKYKSPDVLLENHLQDYQRTGTKDGLPKFGYSVVRHLAEMCNATILLSQYGKWRKGDRSGPLTRALEYDEIDMTGTLISVIPEKMSIIKFVYPAWPFRTCFMFRSPQPVNIRLGEILNPFHLAVWIFIIIIAKIFVLCLAITIEEQKLAFLRYSNSILITVGCLSQQCTNIDLNKYSTRITFLSMMLFSLLIYNYYSASVVSARLSGTIIKMPDSLIKLAKSKLQVASEPMIYFDFLMKDYGKEGDFFNETKWQKVQDSKKFMLPEKGMQLVKDGGFAYHTHPDVGYPYVNRLYGNQEICELTEVHLGKKVFRSIAIAYNSTFTEITKTGFARISEVGIRHRQLLRWTSRKPRCRRDILSASSVSIYEFAPHLLLLVTGLWFAIVICFAEIIVNKYQIFERVKTRKFINSRMSDIKIEGWYNINRINSFVL